MLVAGCSGSDSKSSGDASSSDSSAGTKASPSPTVAAAKFTKLPNPCETFSKKTVKELLPKTKDDSGEQGKSTDNSAHGTCAWNSSDDNGVDGTQFRWLDVSFQRYDSDQALNATGEKRATDFYDKQVAGAKDTKNAKKVEAVQATGIGDAATTVTYHLKKDGNDFRNTTVVARTANIVVTLNYNGAGLAGGDTPKSEDLLKDAKTAAKEAVAGATDANSGKAKS
jgi:hypothetical protein